jgi:AbiV family abortive infection protein
MLWRRKTGRADNPCMENSGILRNINKAIPQVLKNGDRLVEDARQLLDYDLPPTAYALCILAQEEYAKAFLLHLISTGDLPWTQEVRSLLRDHTSKQLVMSIMDFLQPEDLFKWLDEQAKEGHQLPSRITDALNIIRHEKSRKAPKSSWLDDSGPPCDKDARKIADGHIDKNKQNAIYVEIGKNGEAVNTPEKTTTVKAKEELEKTERLKWFFPRDGKIDVMDSTVEAKRISLIFRFLFGQCTAEEFSKAW